MLFYIIYFVLYIIDCVVILTNKRFIYLSSIFYIQGDALLILRVKVIYRCEDFILILVMSRHYV